MSDRDYYEILGLTPRADGAMVDQAYWHLARKYQQLAVTNPRAQYLLDELNEAYGVLGNPRLREQYDAFRDDVLMQQGLIKPVPSKPKRQTKPRPEAAPSARPARERQMPSLNLPNWRWYGLSAVIAALALAGAWAGVSLIVVAGGLVAGLALSLTPLVTRKVQQANLSMPSLSMPSIQMPELSMPSLPEVAVPGIRDVGFTGSRDEVPVDADSLRASTADTIARWRNSVGLKPTLHDAMPPLRVPDGSAPDRTLVEIVETERDIDAKDEGEPLNAVMDILRRSRPGAETRG
jgi:DnaJ-like protein